ncbi:MAG: NAD(P)-dependent alcohol dehydrogenase [Bacteroidales bacterium]|nr:NAD(P)-dependent alcohol dehydrogenase [Bacteroidales bacterium]
MKTIIYTEYGNPEVLKVQEMLKPYPKDGEVLIKVQAVSVNFGDLIARRFRYVSAKDFNMPFLIWIFAKLSFGLKSPRIKILGNSFAGTIEQTGSDVRNFRVGDDVFGYTGEKMGAYSEYLCVSEKGLLAHKPTNTSYEEASTIPYGSLIALCLLKKVNIEREQKVLVFGASGGIGSAVVQLAKNHFGAEVTGVCSTERVDYVKKLGAGNVIDYKREEFSKNGETYDHIIDILGKGYNSSYKTLLNRKGTYLFVSFKAKNLLQMLWTKISGQKKVICALVSPHAKDLQFIKELVEEDKIRTVIDRVFKIDQAPEAHRHAESAARKGDVVIKLTREA